MTAGHGTVVRPWSWLLLVALLLALLAATLRSDVAVTGERETTFRMAALSLAWDGDLTYGRADYDRYVRIFGAEPAAVGLETSAGGARVGFARPPAYAALAAPFVRLSPRWGPALLNWLLLAVAAAGSALVLERRAGPWAPAWIAVFVAGTTTFAYLPLSSPGTFRLAASALAWALVVHVMPAAGGERRPSQGISHWLRRRPSQGAIHWVRRLRQGASHWVRRRPRRHPPQAANVERRLWQGAFHWVRRRLRRRPPQAADNPRRPQGRRLLQGEALRWSLVGLLLALAVVASVDGLSFLPALAAAVWLALRQARRRVAFLALAVTATLTVGLSLGVSALARGGVASVERAVFDRSTGFPAVDFEAEEWPLLDKAPERGVLLARPAPDLASALSLDSETVLHAAVGRTIGIAPTCVPLVWAAVAGLFAVGWRWALLLGGLASVALRVALFPFDLGDESVLTGPGGVLAVLPMFWFLAGWLGPVRVVAVAVCSAFFLYPLWLRPGAAVGPSPPAEGVLHRLLPEETGQRPRAGEPADLFVGDIWLRSVAGRVTPFGEAGIVIEGGSAELLVAWESESTGGEGAVGEAGRSRRRILLEQQAGELAVVGGEVEQRRLLPSGRALVRLLLDPPEARHRMWWSSGPVDLFRLRLTLDGSEDPTASHVLRIGSVP